MRIINLIEQAKKHNEILIKWVRGGIWMDNPAIPDNKKLEKLEDFKILQKELSVSMDTFENMGIKFNDYEAIECIELPEEVKRKDVEIWLEGWAKIKKQEG